MSISPARVAAFRILETIESCDGFSSELLPEYEAQLSERDRSLCHAIVLGVLRGRIRYDRTIDALSSGKKVDPEVRIALRMGLYQIEGLDRVPNSAAVNESVELVRKARKASAAGFVNAILRKVARERPGLDLADAFDRLSVETSHPRWLLERWANRFGVDESASLARANNDIPVTAFRLTVKGSGLDVRAELGDAVRPSSIAAGGFVAERSTPELRRLESERLIYLQDEGSQLVGEIAASLGRETLLDVCAAPGSKTGLIAQRNPRLDITACDVSPRRLETLRASLEAQGVRDVETDLADASAELAFEKSFDTVLVDAPCSGTGTIRHNPEIRYRLAEGDLIVFQDKQRQILENASQCVSHGGYLVYSTCSLESEENEGVVNAFLSENKGFELHPFEVPTSIEHSGGVLRTFPHRDGTDGFFAVVLRRAN